MTKPLPKPAPQPTLKPRNKKAAPDAKTPEPGHKQRFEQLLDDVVLGVPPKR
jgi:hypothetical protein